MSTPMAYEAPELTVVGSFEQVTQGLRTGPRLDQPFPNDTPVEQLTFS